MNTANDKPNVVDLQARSQGSNGIDRVGDLVKLVRTVSLARITSLVGTLFDNVDDALKRARAHLGLAPADPPPSAAQTVARENAAAQAAAGPAEAPADPR